MKALRAQWIRWILPGTVLLGVLFVLALWRGGLLGLPAPPKDVDAASAGLVDLAGLGARASRLERAATRGGDPDSAITVAGRGLARVRSGDLEGGLDQMRAGLALAPRDLVIGNAFRMAVFDLRRAAFADTAGRMTLAATVPAVIEHEPFATFEALRRDHPCREVTLQLGLARVDELLLNPALEIQAPSSVESVSLFTSLLREDPSYVPALYGRGLNYLHRPLRLVWPEARKAAPDAASHDIGLCVAIGRRIGGATPRLVATLALTLGDAYAKEGHSERARSWWQVAQNTSRDSSIVASARRRFEWRDENVLDQLEAELERNRLDLDHPLSDLSVMWR